MNVYELINWAVKTLEMADIKEAKFEAREIMMYVMKCNMCDLLNMRDKELDYINENDFRNIIKRRTTHYPLQYITGSTGFYGFEFLCEEGVLIPRFDTENLVADALLETENQDKTDVLDVCTGTGCVGITYKLMREKSLHNNDEVTISDISSKAIELAGRNAVKLGADIKIVRSDLFGELGNARYDMIISNPPYIKTEDIKYLMKDVRDFEPMLALDGSSDGLEFYRRISNAAPEHLKVNGKIEFEIGSDETESVKKILSEAGFKDIVCKKDLNGLDRIVKGTLK